MVPEEPAVDGTGDETLARELLKDLRETQAKLDAAREEAASLKVLLTLRTHQHDQAWQTAQERAHALDEAHDRAARLTGDLAAARTRAADAADAAQADERTEAVRIVLNAVLASIGSRALDRRRFQDLIAQAGRATPDQGPGAARHAVLLTEARRVLGISA